MPRIYTGWVITTMQYMQPCWDSSMVQFPRKPMRPCCRVCDPKYPVTVYSSVSFPEPTGFWCALLHFLPKSLFFRKIFYSQQRVQFFTSAPLLVMCIAHSVGFMLFSAVCEYAGILLILVSKFHKPPTLKYTRYYDVSSFKSRVILGAV